MKFTETLKAALAKVTFPSSELQSAIDTLLNTHKSDLSDVGYEPSTDTEDSIKAVNAAIDELDESTATKKADLKEAAALAREEEVEG